MKRLILCRHAESLYNVKGLINADSASTASPLTEQGREQARALGQSLSRSAVHLCVTSETPRAVETAKLALAGQRVPRVKLSLLNDPPAGHFEDGPVSLFAQWIRDHGIDSVVPGTETTVGASAFRYLDAARLLLSRSEDTVLVIAHAPALRWFRQTSDGSTGSLDYEHPLVEYAEAFEVTEWALRAGVLRVARDPAKVFWL